MGGPSESCVAFGPVPVESQVRKDRINEPQEFLAVCGALREEVVGPVSICRLPVFGQVIAGQDDDHDMRINSFYMLGELEAVLSGDVDVHEDKMRRLRIDHGEHFIPIHSLVYHRARQPCHKDLFEGLSEILMVFDDQYPERGHLQ